MCVPIAQCNVSPHERRDTIRVTKMSGKGVLFTHQSPARTFTKLTLHTGLRGVFKRREHAYAYPK